MIEIEAQTKKWGNSSLAFVIPKDVVRKQHLRSNQKLRVFIAEEDNVLEETFGILSDLKKPTDVLLREVDEELWNE